MTNTKDYLDLEASNIEKRVNSLQKEVINQIEGYI
jgi:hypothetical protein